MSDLKSCPCGGDAKLIYERGKSYSVHNGENYTSIRCSVCSFNADHVDDWNTRADGWISVDERLPDSKPDTWSEPVIALSDDGLIYKLSYFNGKDSGCWQRTQAFAASGSKNITHWTHWPKGK